MSRSSNGAAVLFDDPLSFVFRAKTKVYTLWISATYPFEYRGRNLSVHYPCSLSRAAAAQIRLGNGVMIRKDAWLNVPVEANSGVKISIDDDCVIGARSMISAKNSVHLEQNVIMSSSVLIQDHNHAYEDINLPIRAQGVTIGGRIIIEEGCWIGQGAAIVCGAGELVIGRNSVVGANAFVNKTYPPYSVIVGNPARVARRYDSLKNAWVSCG